MRSACRRAAPGGGRHSRHHGDGAWLGAGTIVLPGVTVAAGGVVAAGSVVTADTEPNALYAGVPAVKKKALPPG
jgi:acetyltransferase-like isoleucine patch superfamily enzyme